MSQASPISMHITSALALILSTFGYRASASFIIDEPLFQPFLVGY